MIINKNSNNIKPMSLKAIFKFNLQFFKKNFKFFFKVRKFLFNEFN